ncbi:hypothetical protein BGZ60DRAFT_396889 [Tricladium varicosporioides]|nr:hypothetical protein BGZ60DRAFT_396889 [Hymenoscyphus varicosporioides]
MGKEAVRHFTRLNAKKVIMAVRSIEKGEKAKFDIEGSTKKKGVLEVWECDLASYASVLAFVARLENESRLDAVIANASVATGIFELAEDNESSITINVISTFLLVLLLLPIMRTSASRWNIEPVITIVGSGIHSWIDFPEWEQSNILEFMNDPKTANMKDRYAASKLLQVFAFQELVLNIRGRELRVVVNMISPGLVRTALARNATGWAKFSIGLMKLLMGRTCEMGSRTLVHAAIAAGSDSHGLYFTNCNLALNSTSHFVRSPNGQKTQKQVWKEIVNKLEAIQPCVTRNL